MDTTTRSDARELTDDVACPTCGEHATVPTPDENAELNVSPYRLAFGDYTKVDCANGHAYWVYFC